MTIKLYNITSMAGIFDYIYTYMHVYSRYVGAVVFFFALHM